jgi:hypothetical protein
MIRRVMALLIIFTLGCLLVAPLAPEAQPPAHVPRIGYLEQFAIQCRT